MKVLQVAQKTWREMVRDRKGLALILGLPVAFMVIFGFAFGEDNDDVRYTIAVLDEDAPAAWDEFALEVRDDRGARPFPEDALAGIRAAGAGAFGAPADFGEAFVAVVDGMKYADGSEMFDVMRVASREEGARLVEERDAALLLVIPPDFSRTAAAGFVLDQAGARPAPTNGSATFGAVLVAPASVPTADLVFVGDPTYTAFNVASGILGGVARSYLDEVAASDGARIGTRTESALSQDLAPFDFIAPGLMVFAVLNMAPQVAAVLAREKERRTLERLRLTRMRSLDLLAGVSLAQLAVGMVSLALMIGAALVFDFHAQGSLLLGYAIALVSTFAVLGVGMVIAAFADKQDDAANLGVLFAVPGSFLSGAFFPIPEVRLFALGDRVIQVYDVLPSTHAVRALREVLTLGHSASEVAFEIAALVVLALAYFAVGAWLYARRRLRAG